MEPASGGAQHAADEFRGADAQWPGRRGLSLDERNGRSASPGNPQRRRIEFPSPRTAAAGPGHGAGADRLRRRGADRHRRPGCLQPQPAAAGAPVTGQPRCARTFRQPVRNGRRAPRMAAPGHGCRLPQAAGGDSPRSPAGGGGGPAGPALGRAPELCRRDGAGAPGGRGRGGRVCANCWMDGALSRRSTANRRWPTIWR
ncbi:hypothetical protein Q3H58_000182 [Pseudomonas psychrotolerans]|nr:hypothetical protein [Pseudomonas psychrotolerans]